MSRLVFCGECRRALPDDMTKNGLDDRTPCPDCGSLSRHVAVAFSVSGTGVVKASGSATGTVEPATSIGYPVTHRCTVQIAPTGDPGVVHAEVVRDGQVVASGMGDNVVDALLSLIEYMLPPDDPEYPPTDDGP